MKIRTCAALLIAVLLLSLLAGCAAKAVTVLDAAGEAVEQRLDAAEDAVEAAVIQAVIPEPSAPATTEPAPTETVPPETAAPIPAETVPPAPAEPAAPDRLTADQAKAIALDHAGLTAGQVKYLQAEFDRDDRIDHYDVEFRQDRWEYEYEIHAETGEILSAEKDWDD